MMKQKEKSEEVKRKPEIQQKRIRKLIFIRHGDYKEDGSLTERARIRIKQLGNKLKEEFENEGVQNVRIIASPLRRARETTSILAQALGKLSNISTDEDVGNEIPKERVERAVKKYMKKNVDALIIVSHYPSIRNATGEAIGKCEVVKFETTKEGDLSLEDFVKIKEKEEVRVVYKEKTVLTDEAKELLTLIGIGLGELSISAGLFAFIALTPDTLPYLPLKFVAAPIAL